MIVRLGLVAAVLAGFVVLGMPWNGDSGTFQPSVAAAAPVAGPASTVVTELVFSREIDSNARPIGQDVEFGGSNHDVWASFEYREHDANAQFTYLVRANGEDYKWGKLDCCKNGSGRAAFPITKKNGNGDLPGASYEVRLYVNNAEVAVGGFGVKGRGGLDNDDQGHGNDND